MRIGLLGPFGFGNLGDAAIQQAMIHHIRAHDPRAEIYGFSLYPEDTERRHGIRSFPITRLSGDQKHLAPHPLRRLASWLDRQPDGALRRLAPWVLRLPIEYRLAADTYRQLGKLDMLIISGGGQLDDYWGGHGPWSHPYVLLKFGLLTRLRRRKFLFVSVGAGPLDFKLSRLFIRWALSLAHYRSYRDGYSLRYVREVAGHQADDPVYPDPAFSLPLPASVPANGHAVGQVMGLGLIGYFRANYWPEDKPAVYQAYLDKMITLMAWLAGRGYQLLLIRGEAHGDEMVLADLRAALTERGLVDIAARVTIPHIETVEDLLCHLSQTTMVLASRFHNILLAQHVGKPVVALSYQAKIDALMADTGQGQYCLPIADFDVETLKARILHLEEHLDQATRQIAERRQVYQAQLAEQYDRLFGRA